MSIPTEFSDEGPLQINSARMTHLLSLNLPIQNKTIIEFGSGVGYLTQYLLKISDPTLILSVEARQTNVDIHKILYPNNNVIQFDLEDNDWTFLKKYDFGFCYGLLYHLKNPLEFIKKTGNIIKEFIIIETVVSDIYISEDQVINKINHKDYIVNEDKTLANNAYSGIGSRFTSSTIIESLKNTYSYVYSLKYMPNHNDFQSGLRNIFVGSYINLSDNNNLVQI